MKQSLFVLLALLVACGAKGDNRDTAGSADDWVDPYMDNPLPPSCQDTTTAPCRDSEATEEPNPSCAGTAQCSADAVCAALFDGDIGTFVCQACVAAGDPERWCFDDDACCDAAASCVRGLCVVAESSSSDGSSSGGTG